MARNPESVLWMRLDEARGRFFAVLHETERSQTAVMTVPSGREASAPETHGADQMFYVVSGEAEIRVWENGPSDKPREGIAKAGTLIVVPAGVKHWVKSVGEEPLFFLTVYAPPEY